MNRTARFALLMLALLAMPSPAKGDRPLTRPQILLLEASSPQDLRRSLRAFADSAAGGDASVRIEAGEAALLLGNSYAREASLDSAVSCYRRAVALRGDRRERMALVDLLLTRGTPAAIAEARHTIHDDVEQAGGEPDFVAAQILSRLAWAQGLAGNADSAVAVVEEWLGLLSQDAAWAKRFALIAAEANRPDLVWRLALPVAVRSRGFDANAMRFLNGSADTGGPRMDEVDVVKKEVAKREVRQARLRGAMGARALTITSRDGFPLSVTFLPGLGASRPRVAVFIAQPSDTLALFDSLATQLSRQGIAVAILDPRGTRGSVSSTVPGMDVWANREHLFLTRTATDARETLDALVRGTLVDPRGALLGSTGDMALAAAQAVALDSRFTALLLVAPTPAPVERGTLRASLEKSAVPVFIQSAPEELEAGLFADRLAAALPMRQTRVADTGQAGYGAAVFRADPKAVGRLLSWWKALPTRRPATPPSPRR